MTTNEGWHKSSYSSGSSGDNCVEVNAALTKFRDSKNPSGTALEFPREQFAAFIEEIKKSKS